MSKAKSQDLRNRIPQIKEESKVPNVAITFTSLRSEESKRTNSLPNQGNFEERNIKM